MGSRPSPSSVLSAVEKLASGILEVEEEITRRLAYEDLLWMVFRQIWTSHWELNIDLVCWLDDCRTPLELECVLDMARSFWSTISHLRKLAVDDMMNNGLAINHSVNSRKACYREIQALMPGDEQHEDLSYEILRNRFRTQSHFAHHDDLSEYFLNILDIGIQIDQMINQSASSDRAELWTLSQKIFEHNDNVTNALIIAPAKALQNPERKLLDLLFRVSRAKRAFAVPPYSLTEMETKRGMDPARSAEAIPIDRTNDQSYIIQNLSGPMWLCTASWVSNSELNSLVNPLAAQALAICARSSSELVDANLIAASRSGSIKFLCKQDRPKLQRCSSAPFRPALAIKLEDRLWKEWAAEYGLPFETVLSDYLARKQSKGGVSGAGGGGGRLSGGGGGGGGGGIGPSGVGGPGGGLQDALGESSGDLPEIDLVRIRSMIIFNPNSDSEKIFDENSTKRWVGTLTFFQEWFNLKDYVESSELNKSSSASMIYLLTEKLPNLIASNLMEMSKMNPLLTKIIGYSLPAGLSIICRTLEHRYDPPQEDALGRGGEGDGNLFNKLICREKNYNRFSFSEFLKRDPSKRMILDRITGGRSSEFEPPPSKGRSPPPPAIMNKRESLSGTMSRGDSAGGLMSQRESAEEVSAKMAQTPMILDRVRILKDAVTPPRPPPSPPPLKQLRELSSLSKLSATTISPPQPEPSVEITKAYPVTPSPSRTPPSISPPISPPSPALKQTASVQVDDEVFTGERFGRPDNELTERLVQVLEDIKHHYELMDPLIRKLAEAVKEEDDYAGGEVKAPSPRNPPDEGEQRRPAPFTCYAGGAGGGGGGRGSPPRSSPKNCSPGFYPTEPRRLDDHLLPRRPGYDAGRPRENHDGLRRPPPSSRTETRPQIYYELAGEPIIVRRQ